MSILRRIQSGDRNVACHESDTLNSRQLDTIICLQHCKFVMAKFKDYDT